MKVLGISGGLINAMQDSAAALVVNNELVAAAEEERFLRDKHGRGLLPEHAVRHCLDSEGLAIEDVDFIAYHCKNSSYMVSRISEFFEFRFGHAPAIRLVDHHASHAASAFYLSGFDEAMILSYDLSGDGVSTLLAHGKDMEIETLRSFNKPNSLGIFYVLLTEFLGFCRDSDEYKVMGLAAYGESTIDLRWLLNSSKGTYDLNPDFIRIVEPGEARLSRQERYFSSKLVEKMGPARLPHEPLDGRHKDIALSGQSALEKAACDLVEWMFEETGSRNLCIAGGVGLNCLVNQKLMELPFVDAIFVQPAAGDAGTAVGAALEVAKEDVDGFLRLEHAYLGPSYSDDQIEGVLKSTKIEYSRTENASCEAAKRIAAGQIVGWFQGKAEFGPRALGNRSILADPRDPDMKDKVNHVIKYREGFRPFAPSVLEEDAGAYFSGTEKAPFMVITFDVQDDKKDVIPAVVHNDGTSRVQTVSQAANPRYYNVIKEFKAQTGVPVVMNTSFNIKGQPMVNTPAQAIETFNGTGLDAVFLGDFMLQKPNAKISV